MLQLFILFFLICTASAKSKSEIDQVTEPVSIHDVNKFVGLFLIGLTCMIVAGVGIGGGGIFVPILIILMRFYPKLAIPLSSAIIFGQSLANILVNAPKRHPNADRPLIAWDIIIAMEPATIFGAILGSFMNVVLPLWALDSLLIIFLIGVGIKTMKKGMRMYQKEKTTYNEFENAVEDESAVDAIVEEGSEPKKMTGFEIESGKPSMSLEELIEYERSHSRSKILIIAVTSVVVLLISLFKGHDGFNPLDIQCGSAAYWVISILPLPIVILVTIGVRRYLMAEYHLKEQVRYLYAPGDVRWTPRATIVYPLICTLAGVAAGLFGIGGGLVKTPLMLSMGVHPEIASTTSSTMMIFTSSSAVIAFMTFNSLNLNYTALLVPIGFVCALIGRKLLDYVVKKYGRPSFVVLLLSFAIGLSAIGVAFEGRDTFAHLFAGHPDAPDSLCT